MMPLRKDLFGATYDSVASFPSHGRFSLPYPASDVSALVRAQRRAGIASCWILPYAHKAGMSRRLNEDIASMIAPALASEGLAAPTIGFTVHPSDGADEVDASTRAALLRGARVAKLHCSVGDYGVLHANLAPFWSLSDTLHFPVVVHFGTHLSGHTLSSDLLDCLGTLAATYRHAPIVVAHSGDPSVSIALRLAATHENIYLDTTPTVTRPPAYPARGTAAHDELLRLARNGRVLFGSDLPNTAVLLEDQIAGIYATFAEQGWAPPTQRGGGGGGSGEDWWKKRSTAARAGKAVEEVLGAAARRLVGGVDVSALLGERAEHAAKM